MASPTNRLSCEPCFEEASCDGEPQNGRPDAVYKDTSKSLLRRSKSLPILYKPRLSFAQRLSNHDCQFLSPSRTRDLAAVEELSRTWGIDPFEPVHICAIAPALPSCALGNSMSDTHNQEKIAVFPAGMPYVCGWSLFGLVFTTPFFSIIPSLFPRAPHQLFELAELRMGAVAANPLIRHNIALNHRLQLVPTPVPPGPSLDHFWRNVEQECTELMSYSFTTVLPTLVPLMIACGRLVLKLLPPSRHKAAKHLFSPQRALGSDISRLHELTAFVCESLRDACAPIRDSWIEAMRLEFERGFHDDKPQRFVRGLKIFVTLLNVMNLDMINYELRLHREKLVNGLVHVERQYFKERNAFDKTLIKEVAKWLDNVPHEDCFSSALADFEPTYSRVLSKLVVGFVASIRSNADPLPHTFSLDKERIQLLRSVLMDIVKRRTLSEIEEYKDDFDGLVQWFQNISLHETNIYLLLENKFVSVLVHRIHNPSLWKAKNMAWTETDQWAAQEPSLNDCVSKIVCLLRLHWNSASFIYIQADEQNQPKD